MARAAAAVLLALAWLAALPAAARGPLPLDVTVPAMEMPVEAVGGLPASAWRSVTGGRSLGVLPAPAWVRARVDVRSDDAYVVVRNSLIRSVTLWYRQDGGWTEIGHSDASTLARPDAPFFRDLHLFRLADAPGLRAGPVELLARIEAGGMSHVPLQVLTTIELRDLNTLHYGIVVAFGAAMLALIVYSLGLLSMTRDLALAAYVVYAIMVTGVVLVFEGAGFWGLHASPQAELAALFPILTDLCLVAAAAFGWWFMDLGRASRGLRWLCLATAGAAVLHGLIAALVDSGWIARLGNLTIVASPIGIILVGAGAWRQGNRNGMYYCVATGAVALGAVVFGTFSAGLLDADTWVLHSVKIGSGMEFVLLSMALGARLRDARGDTLALQRENAALRRQINEQHMQLSALRQRAMAPDSASDPDSAPIRLPVPATE